MITVLFIHVLITISCFISGMIFYSLFPQKDESRPVIFYLMSGLILLTTCTQIVALFFPINMYTQLFFAIIILLLAVIKRKEYKKFFKKISNEFSSWSALTLILFCIVWLVIILINAGPVIMDDTESYHIQSIKWIQEYGSVPGLVNLHERFGFNSSWFSSVALFIFPDQTESFTSLNSVLSLWFCYWLISRINHLQRENNIKAAFTFPVLFICCFLIWSLLRGNAATTNYDFITTCIVLFLFIEIFLSKNFSPSIEWIIWPAYLFTVRIINFPLLFLSLIALVIFIKQKNLKNIYLPIVYCLLLIIPFVIRNIIITGYPFYPATSFDLVNVDWKPDPQMTERLLEYIKYYNRVSTTYLDIEQTKALGSNWIPSWFKYLFSFDKALVIAGISGIVFTFVRSLIQKNKNIIFLTAISVVWLICWFLISPDPRFVYGILLFGIFLFAYHFILLIKYDQLLKVAMNICFIVMISGSLYYFISKLWKQEEYRNIVFPTKLPQPPVKEFILDGITFRIPEPINNNWNARCYGTSLPCLYKIDPRLKPRGKYISDGFRLKK